MKFFSGPLCREESQKSFTLVELLIVVAILGILASVGIVQYGVTIEKSRSAEAYSVLSDIVGAEKAYYAENSAYTGTIAGLHSFDAVPASANFNYSVPFVDATTGYAQAARVSSGRLSYGICLQSGRRGSCNADTAACLGCP
jgi:prepilin-type N-terminal cleavage/methylation domain-containing protein